ncbi:MAG: sulfatase-like hydrolase/transferase, partial [Acidobacteriota bacterium]
MALSEAGQRAARRPSAAHADTPVGRAPRVSALSAMIIVSLLVALTEGGCGVREREPLLLLLTADALRADHVGAFGGPADLTPNLDAFLADSQRFERAYSTATCTLPSMSALMTGRFPEELGMLNNGSLLSSKFVTLAGVLRQKGWRSGAVVSIYSLSGNSGIYRGFDFRDTELPIKGIHPVLRDIAERDATSTTDAALAMIDRLESARRRGRRGVFLWVHYQEPHGPYVPPDGMRERFLERARRDPLGNPTLEKASDLGLGSIPGYQYISGEHEAAFYRAGYDGEVVYLDAEIGRL